MHQAETEKVSKELKSFNPLKEFKNNPEWITQGIDQSGIDYCERMGAYLCDLYYNKGKEKIMPGREAISSSHLRNVYGEVKRLDMKLTDDDKSLQNLKSSVLLLKPKIAYAAQRAESNKADELAAVISEGINLISPDQEGAIHRFKNFSLFMEAILAYHKSFGGK